MSKTRKAKGKMAARLRIADDDQHRLRQQWDALHVLGEMMAEVGSPIQAVGMEAYTPFQARGGNAWKSALSYQVAAAFAWSVGVEPMVFTPGDLKRLFTGQASASKGDVGAAIQTKVAGLGDLLAQQLKGDLEHLTDAAAHGYLALVEIARISTMVGL